MLDFSSGARLSKGHIQCDAGDNRLPSLVLRQPMTLNGAPKIDDLFLGDRLKEVLIVIQISVDCWSLPHKFSPCLVNNLLQKHNSKQHANSLKGQNRGILGGSNIPPAGSSADPLAPALKKLTTCAGKFPQSVDHGDTGNLNHAIRIVQPLHFDESYGGKELAKDRAIGAAERFGIVPIGF